MLNIFAHFYNSNEGGGYNDRSGGGGFSDRGGGGRGRGGGGRGGFSDRGGGGGGQFGGGFGGGGPGGGDGQPREFYSGHNPKLDDLYNEITNTGINFEKMETIEINVSDFSGQKENLVTKESSRRDNFEDMELEEAILENIKKLGLFKWRKII